MESDNNTTSTSVTSAQEKGSAPMSASGAPAAEEKQTTAKAATRAEESSASIPATPQAQAEISVATIARMMGLATATDMKLLISKIDQTLGRINAMSTRLEKVTAALGQVPTGADLERIDVQIGSLKAIVREALGAGKLDSAKEKAPKPARTAVEPEATTTPEK